MRIMALLLVTALLSACQAQEPLPDDGTDFYGPIARNMVNLPAALKEAICAHQGRFCLADPGERWEGSDMPRGGYPTAQLIWARRMGAAYLVKTVHGGSNIDLAFDIYQAKPGQEKYLRHSWEITGYDYALNRYREPQDVDPRVGQVIRLVMNPPRSCLQGLSVPLPDCRGSDRWPFS